MTVHRVGLRAYRPVEGEPLAGPIQQGAAVAAPRRWQERLAEVMHVMPAIILRCMPVAACALMRYERDSRVITMSTADSSALITAIDSATYDKRKEMKLYLNVAIVISLVSIGTLFHRTYNNRPLTERGVSYFLIGLALAAIHVMAARSAFQQQQYNHVVQDSVLQGLDSDDVVFYGAWEPSPVEHPHLRGGGK